MTNEILSRFPALRHQLDEAGKAATLLGQAARNVQHSPLDAAVCRGAAQLAQNAARELAVCAGMLETLDFLTGAA